MWLPSTIHKAHWLSNTEHKLKKSGALFQAAWNLMYLKAGGVSSSGNCPQSKVLQREMILIPQPIGSPLSCSRKAGGWEEVIWARDKVHLVSRDQCLHIKALTQHTEPPPWSIVTRGQVGPPSDRYEESVGWWKHVPNLIFLIFVQIAGV